jgi:hypothetical protein
MNLDELEFDLSTGQLKRLVNQLDGMFPDVCPDPMLDAREIAFRAGQVSVVRYLKDQLNG